MSGTADLLIEIGTEELPPLALKRLSEAFATGIVQGLKNLGLSYGEHRVFATPRRMAVLVCSVSLRQADRDIERKGPAINAAYDAQGKATPAAVGFAQSMGVTVAELQTLKTEKGAWLICRKQEPGQATAHFLPDLVKQVLQQLPIPKRMRWADRKEEFVRPVHWVVLMLAGEVVPCEILGVKAGNKTYGHRFHHAQAITLVQPQDYAEILLQAKVMVDFAQRRQHIKTLVEQEAHTRQGTAVMSDKLLDEVTGLVEWPQVIVGTFEERFLKVPAEALMAAMIGHQRYFPLLDTSGHLMPFFITIVNIESRNPAVIRAGNERVIRPRLADAEFFFKQDRKHPLESHREKLQEMVFHIKLGTLAEKTRRVSLLAQTIATVLGADAALAARAADLSKCDLLSQMVGEFPELQGIMGCYYAQFDGEPATVAESLRDYYLPRFAGDVLPQQPISQALALADRLDSLAGFFGVALQPTGEKDPFGLRRAALGVLRIILEQHLNLDLFALIKQAVAQYGKMVPDAAATGAEVFNFMMERMRVYLQDNGVRADVIDAVLACKPVYPHDVALRVQAISAFRQLPAAESLAAANKRIRNILKKTGETIPVAVDNKYLSQAEEKHLALCLQEINKTFTGLIQSRQYTQAMNLLADLREPVDRFFDSVLVMSDHPQERLNRLALLNGLQNLFLQVADISKLN